MKDITIFQFVQAFFLSTAKKTEPKKLSILKKLRHFSAKKLSSSEAKVQLTKKIYFLEEDFVLKN